MRWVRPISPRYVFGADDPATWHFAIEAIHDREPNRVWWREKATKNLFQPYEPKEADNGRS
jgi:hypothetical protein